MRHVKTLTLAALVAATPVAAQQGQHAMPPAHAGMMDCMTMMGGAPPAMILRHADELDLSAEQVDRLEALHRARAERAQPMQPMMEAHMAAAEAVKGESPDLEAYEAHLREAMGHMVRAHVDMARAAVEARAILTAEQTDELRDVMASAGHGRMGMAGEGHEQGGMHGMSGMMMHCPMMRGAGHGGHGMPSDREGHEGHGDSDD